MKRAMIAIAAAALLLLSTACDGEREQPVPAPADQRPLGTLLIERIDKAAWAERTNDQAALRAQVSFIRSYCQSSAGEAYKKPCERFEWALDRGTLLRSSQLITQEIKQIDR